MEEGAWIRQQSGGWVLSYPSALLLLLVLLAGHMMHVLLLLHDKSAQYMEQRALPHIVVVAEHAIPSQVGQRWKLVIHLAPLHIKSGVIGTMQPAHVQQKGHGGWLAVPCLPMTDCVERRVQ